MPFTPAHTAILFPARWIKPALISWTALIIGSMVPDTEYFMWMDSAANTSHSLWGILVFDLPMVFLLAFAWHSFIAKGVLHHVPFLKDIFRKRYEAHFSSYLGKHYIVFTVSALAGIISHLAWDSFCHSKGYMVRRIPALLDYTVIAGRETRWCYVLWYISSLAGMIAVTLFLADIRSLFQARQWKIITASFPFYGKVALIAGLIAAGRIAMGLDHNVPRHLVIIGIGSVLYGIIILTFLERKKTIRA